MRDGHLEGMLNFFFQKPQFVTFPKSKLDLFTHLLDMSMRTGH
jgi:hypothetical protein